jgi:hypothetical protein
MDIPGVQQNDINLEVDGQVVRVRRVRLSAAVASDALMLTIANAAPTTRCPTSTPATTSSGTARAARSGACVRWVCCSGGAANAFLQRSHALAALPGELRHEQG